MLKLHFWIVVDMDAPLSVGQEEQVALFVPCQFVHFKLKVEAIMKVERGHRTHHSAQATLVEGVDFI